MHTLNFDFFKKRGYKIWSTLFIYFYMYRIISREFNTWFIQNLERNLCLFLRSLLFFIVYKITLFLFIPPVLETPCIVKRKRKAEAEREREEKKWKKKKKREKGRRTGKKIRRISRMGRPVRLVLDLKPTVCLPSFSSILISLDPPSVRSARFHPCVVVVSDQATPPPFHPFPSFFPRALPASSSFPDLLFCVHAYKIAYL